MICVFIPLVFRNGSTLLPVFQCIEALKWELGTNEQLIDTFK